MKYLFLSGGLGNQMFEYAFFLSCKNRDIQIKLNRDLYEINRMHNGYLLGRVFGVPDSELSPSSKLSVFITRILRRYHPLNLVFSERVMTYCDDAYQTKRPFYDGCFIAPSYFADVEEKIRNAFIFRNIDPKNMNLGNKMTCEDSVSLHVRRGDFLNNPVYSVCNEGYYQRAIEYICKRISNPVFYVFSDDTEWCKKLMERMGVIYYIIDINTGSDSYKDMYLMTKCKHNIIANSTFSWWGAWLNDNIKKIVISPNKWTTTIRMDNSIPNWIFLEV